MAIFNNVPGSSNNKQFGSNLISMRTLNNGRNVPIISFNTLGFIEGTNKLILGGMPLSLAKNNNNFALMIISDSSASLSESGKLAYKTEFLATSTINSKNILSIEKTNDNINPSGEVILNGIPLSITSNNELIMIETSGIIEEEAEFFWGGIPLLARRIEQNWYLVVHEI